MRRRWGWWTWCALLLTGAAIRGGATDGQSAFEEANRLYEQGRYGEAVSAYQVMVEKGWASAPLFFNLGNAHYKAGQNGEAIAAYRLGLRLQPRDPSLRFNLRFVREQVASGSREWTTWWERVWLRLTLNEWASLVTLFLWLWFVLLISGELRPGWRRALRGYTAAAGATALLLILCLSAAVSAWAWGHDGVVVRQETIARYGPLEESQVHFQMRDGEEVEILDRKDGPAAWLRVRDQAGREGWVKAEEVHVLAPPPVGG